MKPGQPRVVLEIPIPSTLHSLITDLDSDIATTNDLNEIEINLDNDESIVLQLIEDLGNGDND